MEWTDEMTRTWKAFGSDVVAMFRAYRAVYDHRGAVSTADWGQASRIGLVLRWINEHDRLPEVA